MRVVLKLKNHCKPSMYSVIAVNLLDFLSFLLLEGKRVTMLCGCQNNCTNLIVQSATNRLGADLQLMFDSHWEDSKFKRDIGRSYSLHTDLILAQGESHLSLCELQKGATVPVASVGSVKFNPLQGLAILVTLQEHFGHLAGLSLGWVGPMGGTLNTLLYLLPKVGINLRYNLEPTPEFPASPIVLRVCKEMCKDFHTKVEGFAGPLETVKGVDIVATSRNLQHTLKIELQMLNEASSSWVFLCFLPRQEENVAEDVFNHKNSLVWTLHENIEYAAMAIALALLTGYKHVIPKPNFGNVEDLSKQDIAKNVNRS